MQKYHKGHDKSVPLPYKIIVCDNNSSDKTSEISEFSIASRILYHDKKKGDHKGTPLQNISYKEFYSPPKKRFAGTSKVSGSAFWKQIKIGIQIVWVIVK